MIDKNLKKYIEDNIFPIYKENESGHGIDHINYVVRRSLSFAKELNLDFNISYAIACYHDICHHIDRQKHEMLSAEFFYNDDNMKNFFSGKERIIIKEAIEDHRASNNNIPRSIYGKVISTADRETDVNLFLKRCYSYTKTYSQNLSIEDIIQECYNHTKDKYGFFGYAKSYIKDIEYDIFLQEINILLKNKDLFKKRFIKVNKL